MNEETTNQEPSKNEMFCGLTSLDLLSLRKHAEEIASGWNGEDGQYIVGGEIYTEEAATCAGEVVEKIDELLPLLEELGNY